MKTVMTKSPPMNGLEVEVRNFGPIAEAKFDLRPLTLFIGPSNSGKSYLAVLIYALHRALSDENKRLSEAKSFSWKFSDEHIDELRNWLSKTFDNPQEGSLDASNSPLIQENFELPQRISGVVSAALRSSLDCSATTIRDEIVRCFGAGSIQSLIHRTGSQPMSASKETVISLKKIVENHQNSVKSLAYNFGLNAKTSSCSVDISEEMPLRIWGPAYDISVETVYKSLVDIDMMKIIDDANF